MMSVRIEFPSLSKLMRFRHFCLIGSSSLLALPLRMSIFDYFPLINRKSFLGCM